MSEIGVAPSDGSNGHLSSSTVDEGHPPPDHSSQQQQQQQSYKGFGSFHSDNVEDLVAIPDDQYLPPKDLPDFAKTFPPLPDLLRDPTDPTRLAPTAFGELVRKHLFTIDESWCFINHGAFGGALRSGINIKRRYEDLMESQMLAFIDRMLLPLLVYSTRQLAKFINARATDVVLVTNATFGLNAAISTVMQHHEDVVAFLDTEYGSVWKMMRERWSVLRCTMHEIPLGKYLNDPNVMKRDEDVMAYIESQLPKGCTVFVVDHIASTSAIMLPIFTHLVPMLKRNGVKKIVVDGAHGPLQTKLDFLSLSEDCQPTFYVGNLHKWVSSPKSVGFIWAHPSIQHKTHTTVVSHGSRSGFASEFIWDGTKDYGAYLAVPAVLDFWRNTAGTEKARQYCSDLLLNAEQMLCAAFGTQPVQRHAPMMALVRLPKYFKRDRFTSKFVQDTLHAAYHVEVPIKEVEGLFYARVSAFVYNDMKDYEKFRDAVLDFRVKMMKRQRQAEQQVNSSKKNGNHNGSKDHQVTHTEEDAATPHRPPTEMSPAALAQKQQHLTLDDRIDTAPHDSDEEDTLEERKQHEEENVEATTAATTNGGAGPTPQRGAGGKKDCDHKYSGCGASGLGGKSRAFSSSSGDDSDEDS